MAIRFSQFTLLLVALPSAAFAKPRESDQVCVYRTRYGEMRQAASMDDVPRDSRTQAQCHSAHQNNNLAKPDDITLNGNVRVEKIGSSVGDIQLRWPRKVESLFGRTPLRAMTDAANTVSRAVKNGAFPQRVQNLNLKWNVVFMDENMPEGQIPTDLVTNCHPGWMTPPANIYIVAQRVAGGCGQQRSSTSVADSTLADVLVHEMGHAVEYYLLNHGGSFDRARAEGFATWWERYASQYSTILNGSELTRNHYAAARYSFQKSPDYFNFQGTYEDYARASLVFTAISGPRGLQGLVDVYQAISTRGLSLTAAIDSELHWDARRLNKEIQQLLH